MLRRIPVTDTLNVNTPLADCFANPYWLDDRCVFPRGRTEYLDSILWAIRKDPRATLAVCNGCFDLLHAGHISMLEWAKAAGWGQLALPPLDSVFLVALVNDDDGVRALKGDRRPVVPFFERLYALSALKVVDCVVGFRGTDPEPSLSWLRPDALVKGAQYAGRYVSGSEHAGAVHLAPTQDDVSTTGTVNRITYSGTPVAAKDDA